MAKITLEKYLWNNRISKAEAARQLGVSVRTVFFALKNQAGKKTALKIEAWTGGRVSAIKLMGM